jgi:polyisoprenoid-binding protein YceI
MTIMVQIGNRTVMTAAAAGLALLVAGCGNPAENVTPARIGDATTGIAGADAAEAMGTPHAITAASKISFVGSKVTGSHDGGFNTFSGTLMVDNGKLVAPGSKVEIDMTSIWTDTDRLTNHLKSPDFFEVETYPTTTFVLTDVTQTDDGATIIGDLTLHGVTKQISFPATVAVTDGKVTVEAEFYLKRFDFDIVYPGQADDLIRDEVVIRLAVAAQA